MPEVRNEGEDNGQPMDPAQTVDSGSGRVEATVRGSDSARGHRDAGDVSTIVRVLTSLRAAARRRLIFQVFGAIGAALIVYIVLAAAIDFALRMPTSVRMILWTGALATCVGILWRVLPPVIRFRPALTEIALRLERTEAGRRAGLAGVLASGFELGSGDAGAAQGGGVREELQAAAARNAVTHLATVRPGAILLNPTRTSRVALWLAGACTVAFGLSVWKPDLARIGTARVLTPWSRAAWPKRTMITDAGVDAAHPSTAALPLRAVLTKTPHAPGQTDVTVVYRVIADGKASKEQRALLTPQSRRGGIEGEAGEMYERLLEPAALTPAGSNPKQKIEFEYRFTTDDDETDPRRIVIVEPPAIRAAEIEVTPPAYAASLLGEGSVFWRGQHELIGNGTSKSEVGPLLAGSRVSLKLTLNKAVPAPAPDRAISSGLSRESRAVESHEPEIWTVTWTAVSSGTVRIPLVDEYGMTPVDESAFRVEVVADRPTTSVMIEPARDETVLPTAVVEAVGEGRDDVGVAWLRLETQIARKPAGSNSPPQTAADPEAVAEKPAFDPGEDRTRARVAATLDLAPMTLNAGDEVWLTALAADVYDYEGQRNEPTRSLVRRLRIISGGELVEQIRAELGGVREAAQRLEREQSSLISQAAKAAQSRESAAEQSPRQRTIADRLGPLDDVLKRLSKRIEKNKLEDKAIKGLVEDAAAVTESAAQAAAHASESMRRLAKSESQSADRQKDAEQLGKDQKEAAEALEQLARMLDSGTDTWAVRRELEKLLTEQRQVQAQTSTAGQNSRGQDVSGMSPSQREELERLARRQQEIAQKTSSTLDQLDQRAEQMKKADPGQAEAMKKASQQARQAQLEANQRQAAEQIRENQTSQAESLQQQASAALEQMLNELDRTQQKRDETLRRFLAEVIEQLRGLVREQNAQLTALADGINAKKLAGLDAGMIRLNRDTEAVADRVRQQMRQGKHIVGLLENASDAQAAAITTLRSPAPDGAEADEQERQSLTRLREALEEAEKQQQSNSDRENQRKKAELAKAYRESLEAMVAIKGETDPFVGKELSRRDRATARELSAKQDAVRERLSELQAKTAEVSEAATFDYAHRRLDSVLTDSTKKLAEGVVDRSVSRAQTSAIGILRSLVAALKDPEKQDKFRENAEGGGGQSGGGQPQRLLPPASELRLLRMMQAETMDRTREAAEATETIEPTELQNVIELQRDLADLARKLLESVNGNGGPPAPRDLGELKPEGGPGDGGKDAPAGDKRDDPENGDAKDQGGE